MMENNLRRNNRLIVKIITLLVFTIGIFNMKCVYVHAVDIKDLPLYYGLLIDNCNKLLENMDNSIVIENEIKCLGKHLENRRTHIKQEKRLIEKKNLEIQDLALKIQDLSENIKTSDDKATQQEEIKALKCDILKKQKELLLFSYKLERKRQDYDIINSSLLNLHNDKKDIIEYEFEYMYCIVREIKNIFRIILLNKVMLGLPGIIADDLNLVLYKLEHLDIKSRSNFCLSLREFYYVNKSLNCYFSRCKINSVQILFKTFKEISNDALVVIEQTLQQLNCYV